MSEAVRPIVTALDRGRPEGGSAARPDVVVVGAAARDRVSGARGGWRLGGGAAYGALVLARLGLRVGLLLGVDPTAAEAPELDGVIRPVGIDLATAPLDRGPAFTLGHDAAGRRWLASAGPSDAIPTAGLPPDWAAAPGWLLAPVDGELGPEWAAIPPPDAAVGLAWQGLLRDHGPDGRIRPRRPAEHPLVRRATVVGVSLEDLAAGTGPAELAGHLGPAATLIVTDGHRGGWLVVPGPAPGAASSRRYAASPARPVDPTGAGDVFLAAFLAATLEPRLLDGQVSPDRAARFAAAVAALVVEGSGLGAVPDLGAIRTRRRDDADPTG